MRRTPVVAVAVVVLVGAGAAIAIEEASVGSAEAPVGFTENWGFEPEEGFSPGYIGGQAGWATGPTSTAEAHIDTANPHSGIQHVRISGDLAAPAGYWTGAVSPTVADLVADSSSVSLWVSLGATGGAGYGVLLGTQAQPTANVWFYPSGDIGVFDGVSSVDTGFDWAPGSYVRLVIDVDPVGNTITYRYGGTQIYSSAVFGGQVIEFVILESDNCQNGEHGDFDDLIIDRGTRVPILHRWSFTTGGSDPIGGADAVLHNGASVSGGALVLDGVDDYAELPIAATLSQLTDVSVEMWVTWTGWRSWERFFDFGSGETVNWFMTPSASQTGAPRVAITTSGNPGEQRTDAPDPFPSGTRTHVMYTLAGDGAADQSKLYINGSIVAVHNEASHLDPAELGPLTNMWLGRSQYAVDPYLTGAIDEFVIHGAVLTDAEVLARYRAIFSDGFDGGDASAWSATQP
jgi:hypothetical protein